MINDLPQDIQDALTSRGNFEITKICPKGGNSYVVLGKDEILDRNVAIKFIYDDSTSITEEPKKLFGIEHENVLKVYDAKIFAEDSLYFITPVANGGDLDDLIESKTISVKNALKITHGILSGINQLHCPPEVYVHRDIKPSNVFMNNLTPLIGDFGSIKKLEAGKRSVPASQMSLFYKTPESILNKQHYIQSDIYQVGLILYKLLGGFLSYKPIDYMNEREKKELASLTDSFQIAKFEDAVLFRWIKSGKIIDRKSLPLYIPNCLIRLLNKATNKDYKKRFSSITDFMHEIIKILPNVPDWIQNDSAILLQDYKKKDYKIEIVSGKYYIHRKTIGSSKWRKEKDSKSDTKEECLKKLMKKIS